MQTIRSARAKLQELYCPTERDQSPSPYLVRAATLTVVSVLAFWGGLASMYKEEENQANREPYFGYGVAGIIAGFTMLISAVLALYFLRKAATRCCYSPGLFNPSAAMPLQEADNQAVNVHVVPNISG